jgi:hypothetical protein
MLHFHRKSHIPCQLHVSFKRIFGVELFLFVDSLQALRQASFFDSSRSTDMSAPIAIIAAESMTPRTGNPISVLPDKMLA